MEEQQGVKVYTVSYSVDCWSRKCDRISGKYFFLNRSSAVKKYAEIVLEHAQSRMNPFYKVDDERFDIELNTMIFTDREEGIFNIPRAVTFSEDTEEMSNDEESDEDVD